MEFYNLIQSRASVRSYDPEKKISDEVLRRILNAGRLAPSAANKQPWKFIVVSSSNILEKVKECYNKLWFKNAPHILIVTGNKEQSWVRNDDGYNAIETDLTIAMVHLILAAENEGVGTCFIANYNPVILNNALSLNKNEVVFSITPLGYPEKDFKKLTEKNRKELNEIVRFI